MTNANRPGSVDTLANLYRETIIRHAGSPVGYDDEIATTHECEKFNPLCGDRIIIRFQVEGNQIVATAFSGEACAICMASASILCEELKQSLTTELVNRQQWLSDELTSESQADIEGYDSMRALLGVKRYPSRIRCALLPWEAAIEALSGRED